MQIKSLKKETKLVLVIASVVLIVAVAVTFSIISKQKPQEIEDSRQFNILDDFYVFDDEPYKVTNGDGDNNVLSDALFVGRIENTPYFSEESGVYEMKVRFSWKERAEVSSIVVLGEEDELILTRLTENGVVGGQEEWILTSVKDLNPILKEDDPIFIKLYLADEVYQIISNKEECIDKCRDLMTNIEQLGGGTKNLIKQIRGVVDASSIERIGPVSAIIIYR